MLSPDAPVTPVTVAAAGASPAPAETRAPSPTETRAATPAETRAATPAETILRPAPGLARGRWEAPAWALDAVAVAAVLALLAWAIGALFRALRTRLRVRPRSSSGARS